MHMKYHIVSRTFQTFDCVLCTVVVFYVDTLTLTLMQVAVCHTLAKMWLDLLTNKPSDESDTNRQFVQITVSKLHWK